MSIIVFGTSFIDIKGLPDRKYVPDGCSFGTVLPIAGGVGRNIACDLGILGEETVFVSAVDDSLFADSVISSLQKCKVRTDYISIAENGLGIWMAMFDDNWEVRNSLAQRPDLSSIRKTLKTREKELFTDAKCVIAEADLDSSILDEIFRLAEKYSLPVYSGVSSIYEAVKQKRFIQNCDLFICNSSEAEVLFDEKLGISSSLRLQELCRKTSINAMVVTLSDQGCIWYDGVAHGALKAEPVEVIDTTGAGDGFLAGTVIGLSKGELLADACLMGQKVAKSVLTGRENICRADALK